jgi:hypothetical protein
VQRLLRRAAKVHVPVHRLQAHRLAAGVVEERLEAIGTGTLTFTNGPSFNPDSRFSIWHQTWG